VTFDDLLEQAIAVHRNLTRKPIVKRTKNGPRLP
jgi:hypothetical protein